MSPGSNSAIMLQTSLAQCGALEKTANNATCGGANRSRGFGLPTAALPYVRIFSKHLAMQIKACEEGLIELDMPEQFDGAEAVVPD